MVKDDRIRFGLSFPFFGVVVSPIMTPPRLFQVIVCRGVIEKVEAAMFVKEFHKPHYPVVTSEFLRIYCCYFLSSSWAFVSSWSSTTIRDRFFFCFTAISSIVTCSIIEHSILVVELDLLHLEFRRRRRCHALLSNDD